MADDDNDVYEISVLILVLKLYVIGRVITGEVLKED